MKGYLSMRNKPNVTRVYVVSYAYAPSYRKVYRKTVIALSPSWACRVVANTAKGKIQILNCVEKED